MHDFIGKAAPSVIADWKKLGELYATRPEGQEGKSFLDRQDVSDLIKKVREDITSAFDAAAQNPEFTRSLGFGGALDEWLTAIKERGSYLMVRSTGDEDSSYANAGGNISEAYVPTTAEDILKAAGKVVASYFSIPSLANRLNARANPFENELKLAVTMQELIGESPDGTSKEIPVSLVLFTNEPNYGGNERFRIMRLSATHGHGEAVVGNKGVATDSFFLLQSRADPDDIYIVSDIKEKPHRLAPVRGEDGKVRLEKRENANPATPSFNKDMLMRLFELGKQVEARYDGQPTDMEIVVKGKTIYPVQARPVNRPVPKPSYVDPSKVAALEKSPVEQELRGNTQVAGTADAVVIRKADEILVTTTLEDAEKNFHLGQHKLVVIKEPEPADSHFVVNFAGIGIPCIQMDDIEPVQQAIGRLGEGRSMVADIQDASIKVWNSQAASPESCISQGYLTHPAHVTISLDTTNLPRLREGSALKDLQEIIRQVKIASTQKLAHETIEAYCARPELAQLGVESARLLQEMERLNIPSLRGRVAVKAATELDAKIRRACAEAIPETTERLETLFHAKVLETLTFQPPAADGSLGKLSVVTATELLRETEQIVEYAKTLGRQARFADLVVDAQEVPLEATKKLWKGALHMLETADTSLQPKVDTLLQLVDILRASNGLGSWLTLVLREDVIKDPKALFDHLLAGVDSKILATMQKMQEDAAVLRQMRQELPNFAEPDAFSASWQRLQSVIESYKTDENLQALKNIFSSNSLPAVLQAQATMNEVIDLFDKSIKSMKSSTKYSEADKIAHFREMVNGYVGLLESWVNHVATPADINRAPETETPQQYFALLRIKERWAPTTSETLTASREFEVPPALITAGTLFDRHLPRTTEDVFTLTHQNLLAVTNALGGRYLSKDRLKELPAPQLFKDALDQVSKLGDAQILGVNIDQAGLTVRFNLPIRNHSATFEIVYDASSNNIYLQFHFLGQARSRWDNVMQRLNLLEFAKILKLREAPEKSANALHIAFPLEENSLEKVFLFSKAAVDFSLAQRGPIQDNLISNENIIYQRLKAAKDSQQRVELSETMQKAWLDIIFSNRYDLARAGDELDEAKIVRREFIKSTISPELPSAIRADALRDLNSVLLQYVHVGWKQCDDEDKKILTSIATQSLEDTDQNVREAARPLLEMLHLTRINPDAWKETEKLLFHSSSDIRDNALELFRRMVYADPEPVKTAASACLDNPSIDIQVIGLKLYSALARNGQFLEEAHAAATKNLESELENVRAEVCNLYVALAPMINTITQQEVRALLRFATVAQLTNIFIAFVEKGQFLKEAHEMAKNLQSQNNLGATTRIYMALADTTAVDDITVQEVENMMQNIDSVEILVKSHTVSFFEKLAKRGKFLKEAHAIAAKALPVLTEDAINLYLVLANIDEITREELRNMQQHIRSKAFLAEIYINLSKTGKFLQEAYAVAVEPDVDFRQRDAIYTNLLRHKFDGLSQDTITDIVLLFTNGREYVGDKFINLIESNLYNDKLLASFELALKHTIWSLFEPAFNKFIAEATPTAQHTVMKLIQKVAQKGEGLAIAEKVAEKQIQSQDPTMRTIASELLEEVNYRKTWLGWLTSWVQIRRGE